MKTTVTKTPKSNSPDEDIAPITDFGKIDYGIDPVELQDLVSTSKGLKSIGDKDEYAIVKKAKLALVTQRTSIEKRRKTLKSEAKKHGEKVDQVAKDLTKIFKPEEDRLSELIEAEDNRVAAKAKAKADKEALRVEKIQQAIGDMNDLIAANARLEPESLSAVIFNLRSGELDLLFFEEFADEAIAVHKKVISALEGLLEEATAEAERKQQEKTDRLEREAKQKLEDERLAREREELAKQQAEMKRQIDEQEAAQKANQEKIDKVNADRQAALDKQAKDLQDQQDEANRKEREAIEKAGREQKEKEAKDLQDKLDAEEQERQDEEAAAAELRRQTALPELEQIKGYIKSLAEVPQPNVKTPEALSYLERINDNFEIEGNYIEEDIEKSNVD